ncbi:hypothetical protein FCM35_KLT00376 [Carex littledalei]|uniref:DUF4220 domain-containing protein n=1 Tax=Carex littledalei TaxID=544730 RepID=A0A833RW85_9POAL|nr:hypothetical protein FCM35_KLT00376 [Carex littledalei]
MDNQSAPPPAEVSDEYFSDVQAYSIRAATFTCVTALILFVNYFIAVTRFRLWHSNGFLEKIIPLVDHPLTWLISNCASQLSSAQYKNDLYLIWLIVLTITYDNVITISTVSSLSSSWLLRESIPLFNAIYAGVSLYTNSDGSGYFLPLQVLWLLLLVKFFLRLLSHNLVNKVYGLNNSKLVADYMKIEHELTEPNEKIDPKRMTGYKYLVMGEAKINAKLEGPEYGAEVELPESVVTMEKIWKCNDRLLHPSIDTDNRLKDVCLSFAFFKLLKRQYFEYPAAEAEQEKTRRLVFEGLLSGNDDDDDRVYRVIGMEIGFLRDFFYTRYPVTFAIGFPVVHVILLIGMIGVNVWISHKAFRNNYDPESDYLTHRGHNIDYVITNILLIMIIVMEALETLSYVFSDWTKVILICRHVKSRMSCYPSFYYKVLALHCKWKFSRSLNYKIGQYTLLKNYNRNCPDWLHVNCFPCSKWGYSPVKVAPIGINEEKAVVLSRDVKREIVGSLRLLNGYPTKGVASLQRNGVYNDLARTCALKTEFHTLIVWHIATSLCEIHPVKDGGNKESIEPHHSVANHLSNYCAYLMVFLPDLLPERESIFSVKLFFREILSETKEFFREAKKSEDKYNLMMQKEDYCDKVIDMGVKLGRDLMQISDDAHRWKIMSDFWSEFIVFLAPSGKVREHLRLLESGGEFITHLWALLYHAGIVDPNITGSSGYYP